jgi:probable rRNA maturation factor
MANAVSVEVQIASAAAAPPADAIRGWAETVLAGAPVCGDGEAPAGIGELCIRLVDEAESAALNAEYRHRNGPTNVLSFPADIEVPELRVWGDIVICVPLVHAEAATQNKPVDAHFAHLVVHGALHLLGYDHQSDEEADTMESLEKHLLDQLGIPDPYGEE